MAIQDILAAVLNPNGVWDLGGPDNRARLAAAGSSLVAQGGVPMQRAPQMPQGGMPQQMSQQAPQAAPEPAGGGVGGIGDLLAGIFAPQSRGRNETIHWLTQQGYDPGTAKVIASDKGALRSVILGRGDRNKPIEIAGKLVDPRTYQVLADFSEPKGRSTATIDGKLVDTNTGQVIGDYSSQNGGYQLLTPDEIKSAGLPEGVYQRDKEGKITTVGGVREQDPTFGREKDLRQEYEQNPVVKNYQIVRDNYERIRQGAKLATGSGDLAIVFGYMKMLDPTSVVREGEQASAMNAGGVPANVRNLYNRVINGDKLDQSVRDQFVTSASGIYSETAKNLGDFNARYGSIAQNWQLDPGRVVQQPEQYEPLAPPNPLELPLPPALGAPPSIPAPSPIPAPAAPATPDRGVIDYRDWFKKGR